MTTILTAKQHRSFAANLLKAARKPGHQNKTGAKQMAKHNEIMAKISFHQQQHSTAFDPVESVQQVVVVGESKKTFYRAGRVAFSVCNIFA